MTPDRRCYPRQIVSPAVYVNLAPSNSGLLHNLSEGGLAVDLSAPAVKNQVIRLRFDLPETTNPVEATGQITWTNESGQRAGLRFVDLPERSQQEIRRWLSIGYLSASFHEAIAIQRAAARTKQLESCATYTGATQAAELNDGLLTGLRSALAPREDVCEPRASEQTILQQEEVGGGILEMILTRRHLAVLFVVVVALTSVVLLWSYIAGSDHDSLRADGVTTASSEASASSESSDSSANPAGARTSEPELSAPVVPRGAIVLQVAAFTRESDALAVAETLRQKKFPAFILPPRADQYYRVQVGPYADAESASIARRWLQNEGFQAIVKR